MKISHIFVVLLLGFGIFGCTGGTTEKVVYVCSDGTTGKSMDDCQNAEQAKCQEKVNSQHDYDKTNCNIILEQAINQHCQYLYTVCTGYRQQTLQSCEQEKADCVKNNANWGIKCS